MALPASAGVKTRDFDPSTDTDMMKRIASGLFLVALMASVGCTELQDAAIGTRNHWWAHYAWHCARPGYAEATGRPPGFKHFGKGWRQGYRDASAGGGGRVPLFPPTCYWGVHFANPAGHDEIRAWFAGYQDGTEAAKKDGSNNWAGILTSGGEDLEDIFKERAKRSKAEMIPPGEAVPPGNVPMPPPAVEEIPPTKEKTTSSGAPASPISHPQKSSRKTAQISG